MELIYHILSSLIVAGIFSVVFLNVDYIFPLIAAAGAVIFDLFDHTFKIAVSKEPLAIETRRLIKEKGIKEAYKNYHNKRKGGFQKMLLHNPFVFIILIVASVVSFYYFTGSYIIAFLAFGMLLHVSEDIFEDTVLGKNKGYWSFRKYFSK